jgi:uncharacterized membrane protein
MEDGRMVDIEIFNEVPIFELLDNEERQVLAQQVTARSFSKGQVIHQAGNVGQYAYIIQRGLVEVTLKDIANEVLVVDVVDQGGLVGMSALLAEAPHMTTAVAVEDTDAIEIDRGDITTLLQRKPLAGLDIMTMIEKQLRATHELMRTRVVRNPNEEYEESETVGEKMADAVARFGGSWKFVIAFGVVLVVYTTINLFLPGRWDPYPFILLNLFLSMLAAIQAPVIMMSQNRQDARDRLRSELDYRVNLKAELEIEDLLQRLSRIETEMIENRRRARRAG